MSASGAKVNFSKTEGLWIGGNKNLIKWTVFGTYGGIDWENAKVRFLGVNIGEKIDELNEENFHGGPERIILVRYYEAIFSAPQNEILASGECVRSWEMGQTRNAFRGRIKLLNQKFLHGVHHHSLPIRKRSEWSCRNEGKYV